MNSARLNDRGWLIYRLVLTERLRWREYRVVNVVAIKRRQILSSMREAEGGR